LYVATAGAAAPEDDELDEDEEDEDEAAADASSLANSALTFAGLDFFQSLQSL
jgi:hypothetical protein